MTFDMDVKRQLSGKGGIYIHEAVGGFKQIIIPLDNFPKEMQKNIIAITEDLNKEVALLQHHITEFDEKLSIKEVPKILRHIKAHLQNLRSVFKLDISKAEGLISELKTDWEAAKLKQAA